MLFTDTDLVDKTNELCADDLISASIRASLLAIELDAHRVGWGKPGASDPMIFQLDLHTDTCAPDWRPCDGYNETLKMLCALHDNRVEPAMLALASYSENCTNLLRTGSTPEKWFDELDPEVAADLKEMLDYEDNPALEQAGVDGLDLVGADQPDYEFNGYGLRAESWAVTDPGEERRPRSLSKHPHRQEMRYVWHFTRTGELWVCERRRSHTPQVVMLEHNTANTNRWTGGVFNALSRMVNAVLADTVPIWPKTWRTEPPRASRPNPLIRPT